MSDTKAQTTDQVQVTLKKPHRHAGEWHKEGTEIAATPAQAERLKERGKI